MADVTSLFLDRKLILALFHSLSQKFYKEALLEAVEWGTYGQLSVPSFHQGVQESWEIFMEDHYWYVSTCCNAWHIYLYSLCWRIPLSLVFQPRPPATSPAKVKSLLDIQGAEPVPIAAASSPQEGNGLFSPCRSLPVPPVTPTHSQTSPLLSLSTHHTAGRKGMVLSMICSGVVKAMLWGLSLWANGCWASSESFNSYTHGLFSSFVGFLTWTTHVAMKLLSPFAGNEKNLLNQTENPQCWGFSWSSLSSKVWVSGIEYWLCSLLTEWLGASYSISLTLSFITYKMDWWVLLSHRFVRIIKIQSYKVLNAWFMWST